MLGIVRRIAAMLEAGAEAGLLDQARTHVVAATRPPSRDHFSSILKEARALVCEPLLPRGDLANAGIGSVQTFLGPMEMLADDPEYLIATAPIGVLSPSSVRGPCWPTFRMAQPMSAVTRAASAARRQSSDAPQ
jgi:hypothetical protein